MGRPVIARGCLFCVSACRLQNSPCGFLAADIAKLDLTIPKSVRVTTMIDEKLARRRAHENNIARYRRLLQTRLSDVERHFIESRLAEEQTALSMLALAQS